MKEAIVHIGHLGSGGAFGLVPLGKEVNKQQKWLAQAWEGCKEAFGVPNRYPTVLVLGGEIIEGRNPKGGGEDIINGWLHSQIEAIIPRICEWIGKETREVLILPSHKYHGSIEYPIEEAVADKLRIRHPSKRIEVSPQFKRVFFDNIVLRFVHGGSGAFVYLSSANERSIKFNLVAAQQAKVTPVDYSYEYHGHRLAGALFGTANSMWCPCFKLLDTRGQMLNPDAWQPDIGIVITTFEERFGKVRVNNDVVLFVPPFEFEELENERKRFTSTVRQEQIRSGLPLAPAITYPVRVKKDMITLEPLDRTERVRIASEPLKV
jgi:hypothetical protein